MNGKIIKGCAVKQNKYLLQGNPVPWKILRSAFQVFMQGVLKYEGDKLPEFLSSNSERGVLNEDIKVSEKLL